MDAPYKPSMLLRMFPDAKGPRTYDGELNGLSKGSVPVNCEVIQTMEDPWHTTDRRTWYGVVFEDKFIVLRVCGAGDWVDYDEFVVVYSVNAITSKEHLDDLVANSYITRVTELK